MMYTLRKFFRPPYGSSPGYISSEEVFRAILLGLAAGALVGIALLALREATGVGPDPRRASLATALLALVLDLLRRLDHEATGPNGSRY